MPQEQATEKDDIFKGFASRLDPANLEPGILQSSFNMRLQRGTAQPRKGLKRLTDSTLNSQTMVGSGVWIDANGNDNIALIFTDRLYIYTPPQNNTPSSLSSAYMFPAGRTIAYGGVCDAMQALDKLYIFRGRETETRYGVGGLSSNSALDITHPSVAAGATVTVTATWINGYSHQYAVGDEVTIFNILDAQHPSFNATYIVTGVTNTTSFTFQYTNNTGTNINAAQHVYACVVKVKPPLIWNGTAVTVAPQTSIPFNIQTQSGYTTAEGSVPPADFGLYFQNRIICNITNQQLAISDILSPVFDFTLNNFIINDGGNDSIVGVLPWVQNQFLAFMRKSIYLVYVETVGYGQNFDDPSPGANSAVTVLSTDVGCLSRKSIASAGQFVFFLSSKGVHLLTPQLDLKLLGNTVPLSEPIADFFDGINYSYASTAVSSYYNNRFYIAVPWNEIGTYTATIPTYTGSQTHTITCTNVTGFNLQAGSQYTIQVNKGAVSLPSNYDFLFGVKTVTATGPDSFTYSATGTNVDAVVVDHLSATKIASRNNRTLVYNTLNQGWESIDFYSEGLFTDDFAACAYINQKRLMVLSRFIGPNQYGGVYVVEEMDGGDEDSIASGQPILTVQGFRLVEQNNQIVSGTIAIGTAALSPIIASIRTREYTFGTLSEKRYSRGEFQFNNVSDDVVSIVANTHDPDVSETVLSYTFSGNSDGTLRPRIALRGSSIDVTFQFMRGRPALKGSTVYGILANRPMISTE